jgi:putative SOS response-associated peptidase YedK
MNSHSPSPDYEFARVNGEALLSSTVIVGQPNEIVAPIHDRMPVILVHADDDRWTPNSAPRIGEEC